MGYKEALEDGIRLISSNDTIGRTKYYPLCHICGEEVMSFNYIRENRYTCKECKIEQELSDKRSSVINDYDTKERKFKNAITRFERCTGVGYDYKKYEKAIKTIYSKLHKKGWFDSTEEIMVAIELVQKGIKARHQVKFGKYRADFVLPDEKIVLEVDGTLFHTERTREKEQVRDNLIVLYLGPEWEVIRITDEDINKNITRLTKAIKKVKEQRKLYRKYNNGNLPEWYSNKE